MGVWLRRFLTHLRFLRWRVVLRMAVNLFRVRILRQRRLRNVQMALTYRCNHKCEMCSSSALLDKGRDELTLAQWKRVVDELRALGCTHFDLTGGEPTLKDLGWLCELIQYIARKKDVVVSLATNGTLVNGSWLSSLRGAGLSAVLFDVQPGDHDKIVGHRGNYAHISNLIGESRDIGLNVCINTCLGTHNVHDFEKLLGLSVDMDVHVLTNLAAPTGRLAGQSVRISGFRDFYYGLMKKYPLMRSDTTYNYFRNNRCPGGREKIYITCYGEVIQCTFVQISYGNVLEDSLKNIYARFWENSYVRAEYICKHTFLPAFQKWIEAMTAGKNLPVRWR